MTRRGTTLSSNNAAGAEAAPRAFAPAKINLCLHVTGRRADGYHLLDSLVVFAGIGDWLEARPAPQRSLSLGGPFGAALPAGPENLVQRAATALAPDLPLAFALEKHLPPASGIGGGSADAAAALRLVLSLMEEAARPDETALQALALRLGADVPVCLASRPARMRGIGEDVSPLPALPKGAILLVNPGIEVPTPAVFRALASRDNPPLPEELPRWPDMPALAAWTSAQRNDLEAPALQIAPVIGEVLARLRQDPATLMARMSGSGATCFALYADEASAAAAADRIRKAQPGWWTASGPILT